MAKSKKTPSIRPSADFVNPHAESNMRELRRIKKIVGQLEGIARMIEDKRHCYEVIHQVRSASAAMRALEAAIMENHAEHLFNEVLTAKERAKQAKAKSDLLEFIKGRFVF